MTTEREAKCWMLAAGAVVVWACAMVGCAGSPMSGEVMPLNRPATTIIEPTHRAAETSITLSTDTVAPAIIPGSDRGWNGVSESSANTPESATVFSPVTIDVDGLHPVPRDALRFDANLSGLSIAQPLVLTKRLLVAAAAFEAAQRGPGEERLSFEALHLDVSERPLAAVATLAPRWWVERPTPDPAAGVLGVAVLDRSAVLPAPWLPGSAPTPTSAAMMPLGEAKFDSAGVLSIVLGGMVLLFGGEAVVMLMINRSRRADRAAVDRIEEEAAEAEPSIFRFPEPIADEPAESFSRAA